MLSRIVYVDECKFRMSELKNIFYVIAINLNNIYFGKMSIIETNSSNFGTSWAKGRGESFWRNPVEFFKINDNFIVNELAITEVHYEYRIHLTK